MRDESWINKRFLKKLLPNWICPTCNSATLSLENNFIEKPTERLQKIPDYRFDEDAGYEVPIFIEDVPGLKTRFIGFLKCTSGNCNEYVTLSGFVSTALDDYPDDQGGYSDWTDFYYPLFFDPPINIIRIFDNYPKEIQRALKESFSLYWIDNSACANKIRTIVEIVMDDQKVKRKAKNKKGGFDNLSLHGRLECYKKKNQETADFLLAIKWIGNAGSHSDSLSNQQLIDAFELLDHALNRIYIKDHIRLVQISKKINKAKKPV